MRGSVYDRLEESLDVKGKLESVEAWRGQAKAVA